MLTTQILHFNYMTRVTCKNYEFYSSPQFVTQASGKGEQHEEVCRINVHAPDDGRQAETCGALVRQTSIK
jgi:hypothetical protein